MVPSSEMSANTKISTFNDQEIKSSPEDEKNETYNLNLMTKNGR